MHQQGPQFSALLEQARVCCPARTDKQAAPAECGILLPWLYCGQQLPEAFAHKPAAALRPSTFRSADGMGSQEYIGPYLAAGSPQGGASAKKPHVSNEDDNIGAQAWQGCARRGSRQHFYMPGHSRRAHFT